MHKKRKMHHDKSPGLCGTVRRALFLSPSVLSVFIGGAVLSGTGQDGLKITGRKRK